MIINFAFKVYLAKHFSQLNLVAYYTIFDMFALVTRFFSGYKDALITIYYNHIDKKKILELFTTLFIYVIVIIALLAIPAGTILYLEPKIENFSLSWWWISLLFVLTNSVAYFSYLFLLRKAYKIISLYDLLKTLFVIIAVLVFYQILHLSATYQTLIQATLFAYLLLLIYLFFNRKHALQDESFRDIFTLKIPCFKDNTKSKFISLTFMASASYFIYGLLLFAPVFVMLHFKEVEELANLQVVSRSLYFALVSVLSWPLARFLFPEISSIVEKEDFFKLNMLRRKLWILLAVLSPLLYIGCWLFSGDIITLLFPAEYHVVSIKMLNILIVALPFVMYTTFSTSFLKAVGLYKIIIMIDIISLFMFAILFILLKFILVVQYASLYAFTGSMIFIWGYSYYYERKVIAKRIGE
jgi:O-antigen/teichoic acid export membrane protein